VIARRKIMALLGGAAAWPLAARAQQQQRVRRIAVVIGVSDDAEGRARVAAFKETLRTLGWIEGHNVRFDIRFTGGGAKSAQDAAAELMRLSPDIILANTIPVTRAFREQTRTNTDRFRPDC